MPHVPDACRKTEKPGRHTVVRVLDTKIERKLNAWRTAARGELPSSRIHLTLIQKVQYSCGFSGFSLSVNP